MVTIEQQKAKARKSGPSLLRKTAYLGEKANTFSTTVYWEPTHKEYRVAAHVPIDWEIPNLNRLIEDALSSRSSPQPRRPPARPGRRPSPAPPPPTARPRRQPYRVQKNTRDTVAQPRRSARHQPRGARPPSRTERVSPSAADTPAPGSYEQVPVPSSPQGALRDDMVESEQVGTDRSHPPMDSLAAETGGLVSPGMAGWLADANGSEEAAGLIRPVCASTPQRDNTLDAMNDISTARPGAEGDHLCVPSGAMDGDANTLSPLFDSSSWMDLYLHDTAPDDTFCLDQSACRPQPTKEAQYSRCGAPEPRGGQVFPTTACRTLVQECLRFVRSVLTSDPGWCQSTYGKT